ncbi:uncharacterized protein LOC126442822 [Schistocerca serialis cubense]|uniref:uncharacterized protein LOC126442822 n=1 Tax=Schistocerca serialis cubense TaxID=2023355 RepID=UPI00214E9C67|nr:uncharacterized protein LOC126442822 [Schistocerca serialis cubense]
MKLRPPQFIPDKPELWLAMLDLTFQHHGIVNEETKFMIAVSAPDNKTATISSDIILQPPATQKYTRFKQLLTERLRRPVEQRIQQVLHGEKRGHKSPSEFWRQQRSLVNDTELPDTTLQHVWRVQLPEAVITAVALSDAQGISSLISLADKVYTSLDAAHTSTVMFGHNSTDSQETAAIQRRQQPYLSQQLDNLRKQLDGLKQHISTLLGGKTGTNKKSKEDDIVSKERICWYHRRFGSEATRCTSPCNYPNGDSGRR